VEQAADRLEAVAIIATASSLSAACSMLVARQDRKPWSPIRRRVRGTKRSPHDEAHSADHDWTKPTPKVFLQ